MSYYVEMQSEEYGIEEFGPYKSRPEAEEAMERLMQKSVEMNDEVERSFRITEEDL